MSLIDAIGHIRWTLEHSPSSYILMREQLIDLRQMLVNMEIKYDEEQREKANAGQA